MRVWDIAAGYLSGPHLLAEHRDLHGILLIHAENRPGYEDNVESNRWLGFGWALQKRHRLIQSEMTLAGYKEKTPLRTLANRWQWPDPFVDLPSHQFSRLQKKYRQRRGGRIPVPDSSQTLWAQHKYSVMARDQSAYRELGRRASLLTGRQGFDALALELVDWLREKPPPGNARNAVEHMYGHLERPRPPIDGLTPAGILRTIVRRTRSEPPGYLWHQTALTELGAWL